MPQEKGRKLWKRHKACHQLPSGIEPGLAPYKRLGQSVTLEHIRLLLTADSSMQ
jgi:hypothetical protein